MTLHVNLQETTGLAVLFEIYSSSLSVTLSITVIYKLTRRRIFPRESSRFLGVAVSEELEYFRVLDRDLAASARHVQAWRTSS